MRSTEESIGLCLVFSLYYLVTHADGSSVNIAVMRSVCLSVRTIKTERLKLKSPNFTWLRESPSQYLAYQ